MEYIDYTVTKNDEGKRIDKILKKILTSKEINIYEIIRKKLCKINNLKCRETFRVKENDIISIAGFIVEKNKEAAGATYKTDNNKNLIQEKFRELEVLFEDDNLLVINKPKNINVQPAKKNEIALSSIIKEKYQNSSLSFTCAPLHRLDKFTTGILVFSKSLNGARWFSSVLKEHKLTKIYVGLAEGHLEKKVLWENNIIKNETNNSNPNNFKTVSISKGTVNETEEKAITEATPLCYGKYKGKETTLIQYKIITGKKHQIRFQSSFNGFPLYGDTAYGGTKFSAKNKSFFLHSIYLQLPENKEFETPQKIYCKIPREFEEFLQLNLINWNGKLIL